MDYRNAGFKAQGNSFATSHDVGSYDTGLRNYMSGIYRWMTLAMVITGVVALFTAKASVANGALTDFGQLLFDSPLKWVVLLSPLGMVLWLSIGLERLSSGTSKMVFAAFSALMGLSLASVFIVYTGESVARVFFITAAAFAGLSLYGYTTKRDLSGLGSFMFLGVIGIIIASIVNIFLASSALEFAISVAGVLAFAGLTAYDTQKLKEMYSSSHDEETQGKIVIMGALTLYLDAVNMFLFLLRLFGNRN